MLPDDDTNRVWSGDARVVFRKGVFQSCEGYKAKLISSVWGSFFGFPGITSKDESNFSAEDQQVELPHPISKKPWPS